MKALNPTRNAWSFCFISSMVCEAEVSYSCGTKLRVHSPCMTCDYVFPYCWSIFSYFTILATLPVLNTSVDVQGIGYHSNDKVKRVIFVQNFSVDHIFCDLESYIFCIVLETLNILHCVPAQVLQRMDQEGIKSETRLISFRYVQCQFLPFWSRLPISGVRGWEIGHFQLWLIWPASDTNLGWNKLHFRSIFSFSLLSIEWFLGITWI